MHFGNMILERISKPGRSLAIHQFPDMHLLFNFKKQVRSATFYPRFLIDIQHSNVTFRMINEKEYRAKR